MGKFYKSDREIFASGGLQGWQVEVLLSKIKFRTVVASRQIGKTTTLKSIILRAALERPGIEILVIASTLKQSKAIHFRPMFLSNDPIFDKSMIKELNRTDFSVELTNGTRISCLSAESADTIRGRTGDLVIIDEGGHVDLEGIIAILQPVVSARQGDIIVVGTPSGKAHPFYKYHQFGLLGSPFYKKGFRSWTIPITQADIPFKQERIDQAQSILSASQYAQEYMCSFEAQEGLVYKLFDVHSNASQKEYNPLKPLFFGIDFNIGVMNAVVCQIYNEDGLGEVVHVIDEIRLRNTSTEEMSTEINRRYKHLTKMPMTVYPDASGGAGKSSAGIAVTDLTILKKHGFNVVSPEKNPLIQDRVNNLNNMICSANGSRRLLVSPTCKYLIQALTSQTYDDQGKPVKGKGEADLSGPNDALGYLINYRYNIKKRFSFKQQ